MPLLVVNGAQLQCTMGTAPGKLTVLPLLQIDNDNKPVATVNDYIPMVNIGNFAMCQSPSNPQVAAATAAAMGVLTPQPCVPVTTAAWSPGNTKVTLNEVAVLTATSTCNCAWAGTISITDAATTDLKDE